MEELLGPILGTLPSVSALNLDSGVFLNRGDHLEWRPLPARAQLAPAYGLAVSDLDGDGTEDVFLSQNHFGVHSDDMTEGGDCSSGDRVAETSGRTNTRASWPGANNAEWPWRIWMPMGAPILL